jgi:hypothetical protein
LFFPPASVGPGRRPVDLVNLMSSWLRGEHRGRRTRVAYRLDRRQQLTGWTPRTLDGLMKSLLSVRLFPAVESRANASAPE